MEKEILTLNNQFDFFENTDAKVTTKSGEGASCMFFFKDGVEYKKFLDAKESSDVTCNCGTIIIHPDGLEWQFNPVHLAGESNTGTNDVWITVFYKDGLASRVVNTRGVDVDNPNKQAVVLKAHLDIVR